jgi:broad specificity phosphatase PhoE
MTPDNTCLVHLIRHGATANNLMRPPRLQGNNGDHPLTEAGRRQAQQTAEALAERSIAAVYSSPLQRAVETAVAVAARHRLDVATLRELQEVDVGDWEGLQWDEIEASHAEDYERFMRDPGEHGYPGGETMRDVVARVAPALEALMARHVGEEIVVVAHNVVNRSYLGSLLGLSAADCRAVPQDNCGVNLIRYRDGRVRAVSINSVLHLQG